MSQSSFGSVYKFALPSTGLVDDSDHDSLYVPAPIATHLDKELRTSILDDLGSKLSFVARKSSDHIDTLHQHLLKERSIKIAEDPSLHLVWYQGSVLIKPIPLYLLNIDFWKTHLLGSATICEPDDNNTASAIGGYDLTTLSPTCRSALGYMRTYSFLIQHRSDLLIAQQHNLLPTHITFSQFEQFIVGFHTVPDAAVSTRYLYGQMRFGRLNLALRLFRPRSKDVVQPQNYHFRAWKTGDYVYKLIAPGLFVFAALSLILSSMQVVLAARAGRGSWVAFSQASWVFGIVVIVAIPMVGIVVSSFVLVAWLVQLRFGYRNVQPAKKVHDI